MCNHEAEEEIGKAKTQQQERQDRSLTIYANNDIKRGTKIQSGLYHFEQLVKVRATIFATTPSSFDKKKATFVDPKFAKDESRA